MNASDEQELKKEFQLERIIFFSDAVFAIIITIMVLDVKLPELAGKVNEADTKSAFLQILPKLSAYTISFFVIGSFWMRHLKVFSFLKDFDKPLIVINLIFLFSISLFPFALSFGFSNTHIMHYLWGYYTYTGIFCFAFFVQTALIGYVITNGKELCVKSDTLDSEFRWKTRRITLFTIPIYMIFLYFVLKLQWDLQLAFIPLVAAGLIIRIMGRKYYPDQTPIKKLKRFVADHIRKPKPKHIDVKTAE